MDLTLELIVALFIFGVFIAVCCALAIAPSLNSSHLQHSAPQRRPLGVAVDAPILGPVVPSAGSPVREVCCGISYRPRSWSTWRSSQPC